MAHPATHAIPQFHQITEVDPVTIATVCDDVLNELDAIRQYGQREEMEQRVDRLELAVLTLATAIRNQTI